MAGRKRKLIELKIKMRIGARRLKFRIKKLVGEPVPEIRSEIEVANLLNVSGSVGYLRKVTMGLGLKTSNLPFELPPEENYCECFGLPRHLPGTCLRYKEIIKDKERTRRRFNR